LRMQHDSYYKITVSVLFFLLVNLSLWAKKSVGFVFLIAKGERGRKLMMFVNGYGYMYSYPYPYPTYILCMCVFTMCHIAKKLYLHLIHICMYRRRYVSSVTATQSAVYTDSVEYPAVVSVSWMQSGGLTLPR
jgi:hypothetical protein